MSEYRPVGIDQDDRFAPDVIAALADDFVTKPSGITDGQVPVWNATSGIWVAGSGGSGGSGGPSDHILPMAIDGGYWNPDSYSWETGSGWIVSPEPTNPSDLDGGTPMGN